MKSVLLGTDVAAWMDNERLILNNIKRSVFGLFLFFSDSSDAGEGIFRDGIFSEV